MTVIPYIYWSHSPCGVPFMGGSTPITYMVSPHLSAVRHFQISYGLATPDLVAMLNYQQSPPSSRRCAFPSHQQFWDSWGLYGWWMQHLSIISFYGPHAMCLFPGWERQQHYRYKAYDDSKSPIMMKIHLKTTQFWELMCTVGRVLIARF